MSTAPNSATPNAPPSDRKNVVAEVTTPRSRPLTAFCAASDNVGIVMPTPYPTIAIETDEYSRVVSVPICDNSATPTVHSAVPMIG